ncbi:MAG: RNA 2',3'-cyclic phosphodiesterase [Dehalococcoidales bacterium]|nr:RNA 2',3'-cyclic phosphodiesterase [Dehalococcoidales bacterium]
MEEIRSFIAIEMPRDVKALLARLQGRLRARSPAPVKWVEVENIHLTLKFLGNVRADRVSEVSAALREACRGVAPFHLKTGGIGAFPDTARVQVIWVGLNGDLEKLVTLQKRIDECLSPLGFAPEARPFTPHITLGRTRDNATRPERQELGKVISGMTVEDTGIISVESVNLMRSQLTGSGPIYSVLASCRLE